MLKRRLGVKNILPAIFFLLSFHGLAAGDPVNGKALYYSANGAPLSCAASACHGPDPARNTNNIEKGINSPTTIQNAINNNTGGMSFLGPYLNAAQIADIAAYLGNPGGTTAPVVSLTATSLSFSGQVVGTASSKQTVTLTNTGNASLSLTSLTAGGTNPGDFSSAGTCVAGATVAASASCTIDVVFAPTATGSRSANISFASNGAGSPHAITLSGTGNAQAPQATLTPIGPLVFGNVLVGSTSAAQAISLKNTGTASLTVSGIALSGADFGQINTCGTSVAAGVTCSISVTFTPTSAAAKSGLLTITDNATGSPRSVMLTGTGTTVAGPPVTLNPNTLAFASQTVSTTAAAQTSTLTNAGTTTLNISTVSIAGIDAADFAKTGTCVDGASIAPNGACTITVTFTPVVTGVRSASINIVSNAAGNPTVTLAGTGTTVPRPAPALAPATQTFASQPVGTTSAPQAINLSNTGSAALAISGIAASGDFSQSHNCGTSLAPGAICQINVTFTPTATGIRSGAVNIADNAGGHTATVSGTGMATVAGPSGSSASGGSNLGGGGCAANPSASLDPGLPFLALLAAAGLVRRRYRAM